MLVGVCVWEVGGPFFLSLYLFYPRDFIEVSGSEPSDSLISCIAIVVVMIPLVVEATWLLLLGYDYLLLPPKAYSFTDAAPFGVISIFFQPPFPGEKVPPQCFISSSEPNSSHLPRLEQFSPCYSMGPSCPAPGFGTQPTVVSALFTISTLICLEKEHQLHFLKQNGLGIL